MTNFRRTALAFASLSLAVSLSGCCVTSITSRKVCEAPNANCQPVYEQPIPQGISPGDTPLPVEQPPQPFVPPAPSSAKATIGTKTTQMMRSFGDQVRDTFTRS